jgi:hypothetical protein
VIRVNQVPVVEVAALEDFLSGWQRIAIRAAADPSRLGLDIIRCVSDGQ